MGPSVVLRWGLAGCPDGPLWPRALPAAPSTSPERGPCPSHPVSPSRDCHVTRGAKLPAPSSASSLGCH